MAITENAGICQIGKVGSATVLPAYDMIHLVGKATIVFMDEAVFATISCAVGYVGTDLLANVTGHGLGSGEPSL
jgi:hypothetical protein